MPVMASLRVAMSRSRFGLDGVDLLRHPAAGRRLDHAALGLDLLEQRPGLLGELPRVPFDVPGTAGRIDDVVQVAFLGQDELRVAGVARGSARC